MKTCHYCQKPITKGEKRKTIYSRLTNLETGKAMPFLDDMYFHLACYAELEENKRQTKEAYAARGIKVNI